MDDIPTADKVKKPTTIAMKDGGVAGISAQTVAGIKKIDDEDSPPASGETASRVSQGVTAQKPQTDAQKEQFRKLLRGRPDADKYKFKKGGAVKSEGDDEDSEDGDDTETLEKDLQYARGGKVLPMPSRSGVAR